MLTVFEAIKEMIINDKMGKINTYRYEIKTLYQFSVRKDLRKDDPLWTILCNIVLDVAVRETGIQTKQRIYNQRSQVHMQTITARTEENLRMFSENWKKNW